ncbi:Gamma-glutamyl hydrolase [Bagarius yarrelli]|uniref:Gamma-glutamyl hydrolase n=1 Tax=Bagarius yarrelli TaxID=175774 RepID=A0A556VCR7_BAGYA|nr:Gamma-glutamyl hydrolase [Bagarius yarrelli]
MNHLILQDVTEGTGQDPEALSRNVKATGAGSEDCKSGVMLHRFAALLLPVLAVSCAARLPPVESLNERPLIGILTQEVNDPNLRAYGRTYIPTSYVKYIESGGARVIPISLLFIGGAVDLETSDFGRTAGVYFRLALTANDKGDYFPIWGTCLGFQLLTVQVAGKNLLSKTMAETSHCP